MLRFCEILLLPFYLKSIIIIILTKFRSRFIIDYLFFFLYSVSVTSHYRGMVMKEFSFSLQGMLRYLHGPLD